MLRQRKLHENAVQAFVLVERLNQCRKLFLRRFLRQRMLHRGETAFLGHPALGRDIGMACRIVADDDHGKTGLDAGLFLQRLRRGFHGVDHRSCNLLAINHGRHGVLPDSRLFCAL